MIVAILSENPNTMVSGARNLLESNIPQLSKLNFPPLAKHELSKISELPKSEIHNVPDLSKSEFLKVPELLVPEQEFLEVSKYRKHELLQIIDASRVPEINQRPKYEVVIQPFPVIVTIPGPILGNRP